VVEDLGADPDPSGWIPPEEAGAAEPAYWWRISPEGIRGSRRRILPGEGHRHGPAMVDGGGTAAPGEFLMICCCLTAAADQIDLPRHLEQRQIEGSAGKKWRARPPAEIDISPGGTLADRRGGALDARRDGQERRRREKEGRR
jgi:hypothetical protein